MNPSELTFWLDWYERMDQALSAAHGSITAYKTPGGEIHYAVDESALPALHAIRDLFLEAGTVNVIDPTRASSGTQVWPANWADAERAATLLRWVEEPAYLALDGGFRAEEPEAPLPLGRLIDVLEAQVYTGRIAAGASHECPAWLRIVPELFQDGIAKIVGEAMSCFDLLPDQQVRRSLEQMGLPIELMSPFGAYMDRSLSLTRLVEARDLATTDREFEED